MCVCIGVCMVIEFVCHKLVEYCVYTLGGCGLLAHQFVHSNHPQSHSNSILPLSLSLSLSRLYNIISILGNSCDVIVRLSSNLYEL